MKQQKILLVDDDADFAEAVASFLEARECRVVKARDGREALKLAKLERPDLILMDIMMNERTEGFFTVQEIRRTPELKSVPVFVLSALYQQAPEFRIAPDSGWLGHDRFFTKPVNLAELLEEIRRFAGRSEA